MKRIVIQNSFDLLCLQSILKEYPRVLSSHGCQLSAISNIFVRKILEKINKIQGEEE